MRNLRSYAQVMTIVAGTIIFQGCHLIDCPEPTGNKKKLTIQPNAQEGKDALLIYTSSQYTHHGPTNTTNYGSGKSLVAMESTYDGNPGSTYGLFQFNLSDFTKNTRIKSAKLSLYGCPDCSEYIGNQYGHWNSDGNEGLLQRVTTRWEEDSVTYNTRPSVTTANQVVLPSSVSPDQDYTDIDVTQLVQDMVNNPQASHGFMLSMQNPNYYRSLIFVSSDHPDPAKHPKLVIELE